MRAEGGKNGKRRWQSGGAEGEQKRSMQMALRAGLRLRGHKGRHDVAVGMVASLGCLR